MVETTAGFPFFSRGNENNAYANEYALLLKTFSIFQELFNWQACPFH